MGIFFFFINVFGYLNRELFHMCSAYVNQRKGNPLQTPHVFAMLSFSLWRESPYCLPPILTPTPQKRHLATLIHLSLLVQDKEQFEVVMEKDNHREIIQGALCHVAITGIDSNGAPKAQSFMQGPHACPQCVHTCSVKQGLGLCSAEIIVIYTKIAKTLISSYI